jgi:ABC-type transport system substrate-binding protein
VQCGLRLPGEGRVGPVESSSRRARLRLLLALVAAAVGAAVAIALMPNASSAPAVVVATGGSVTTAAPATPTALAPWPAGTDAWSIVLTSMPKSQGYAAARAIATEAVQRGLLRVGVLDSSRYASLHPGYWIVFAGVYETEPDANGALLPAQGVVKTARVQHISP